MPPAFGHFVEGSFAFLPTSDFGHGFAFGGVPKTFISIKHLLRL